MCKDHRLNKDQLKEKMPIVKSCCFFIPLKLGAIILGVIGVFQCLFQVYRTLPFVLDFDAEIKRVMENDPIDVEFALKRKKCKVNLDDV